MEKSICYYHADMDGICSAGIIKKIFPDVTLRAVQYGDDYEQIISETLGFNGCFIVDFSFPEDIMHKLHSMYGRNFCWIDHHKSAMEKLQDLWNDGSIDGLRKMDKSGCELTWHWFFPHEEAPMIIQYVGDYDTWTFRLNDTKAVGEYLPIIVQKPEDIIEYFDNKRVNWQFISAGELLIKAKERRIAQSFAEGEECDMWVNPASTGYQKNCFVCNSNVDISNLGNYIANEGYDIGIVWSIRKGKLIVNLRSIGDIDVSAIAKNWGGGGHKNASGFNLPSVYDLKKVLKVR